jgi:cell division protease FtsH
LTESYLRARITSALGGRAAEQVIYGSMTTGAENDLKQVTHLARAMVMRWGMSPEVGLVQIEGADEGNFLEGNVLPTLQRPLSEQTAQAVDRAVRRIIDECYEKAVELLTQERPRLDHLAQALLKEEALDEQEILQVTGLAKEQHKPIYVATSPA